MKPLRSSYPPSHLLGGKEYTDSLRTNIRETFKRVRDGTPAQRRPVEPNRGQR